MKQETKSGANAKWSPLQAPWSQTRFCLTTTEYVRYVGYFESIITVNCGLWFITCMDGVRRICTPYIPGISTLRERPSETSRGYRSVLPLFSFLPLELCILHPDLRSMSTLLCKTTRYSHTARSSSAQSLENIRGPGSSFFPSLLVQPEAPPDSDLSGSASICDKRNRGIHDRHKMVGFASAVRDSTLA